MKGSFPYKILAAVLGVLTMAANAADVVLESARQIPIAATVDVVVVGGGTGAVAAAVAASKAGASVFLVAPRPYLGEDMAGTLRLWLEPGETPKAPLAKAIFEKGNPAKPLHVKRVLDHALLDAKVQFLYSSYATEVLRDSAGHPAGVVIANRAGRQAVIAKAIIDATDRAWVARMAGVPFSEYPAGNRTFKRVVIDGAPLAGDGVQVRQVGSFERVETIGTRLCPIYEYTLEITMTDGHFASFANAEQIARDRTHHPDQQFASDMLFQTPPDTIQSMETPFRPTGVSYLFVLGCGAGVTRERAEALRRPLSLIEIGAQVGEAAAADAARRAAPSGVKLPGLPATPSEPGEVREILEGARPAHADPTIPAQARALPILGRYDVVVVGGGTSGAPAGIGAGRQGARVLVLEYLHGLGGVGTQGAIARYHRGYREGFTKQVYGGRYQWRIEPKMEWWRATLREAGAEIWFGAMGCGAFVEGGRIKGVVVATPEGRGVVLADVIVDSTGNADIAAAAGAPCMYTDEIDIAVQGTGLPQRDLNGSFYNTDFTITDETDMFDVTSLFVTGKEKYGPDVFDMGQLVDSRERRRIIGDFVLSPLDQMNQRTYPDIIAWSSSNFDSHGYTMHPYFALQYPSHTVDVRSYTPYRCLLPQGLDGLLVTGLGVSAHRDALPVIRMQADLQNQGYAAGVAAALAARLGGATRSIDIRALQQHLIEIGNIPASALTAGDSYPLPAAQIQAAAQSVKRNYEGAAILLADPAQSLPLLRAAYAAATSQSVQLIYAHVLGILGDATGLETLIAAVEAAPAWDKGWDYKSVGYFGVTMSPLDSLILAIGRTRDRRGTAAILNKAALLDSNKDFSHHRALALALESLQDSAAADALHELLGKPAMRGYALRTLDRMAQAQRAEDIVGLSSRRNSLREIMLARALYRCGDRNGLGHSILTEYTNDLRGHFARHARAVLNSH